MVITILYKQPVNQKGLFTGETPMETRGGRIKTRKVTATKGGRSIEPLNYRLI